MKDQVQVLIGVGVYTIGDEPGTLRAEWARSDRVSSVRDKGVICKGTASGGPESGFVGSYSIVYTDEQGNPSEPFKLTITSAGDTYLLKWENNGPEPDTGIGVVVGDKLVFGWAPIAH